MPVHDQLTPEQQLDLWLRLQSIFDDIAQERIAQLTQWGDEDVPLGFGRPGDQVTADQYKRATNEAAEDGTLTFRSIWLEEVYEALAEGDPHKARDELIQAITVGVAIIQKIDRDLAEAAAGA